MDVAREAVPVIATVKVVVVVTVPLKVTTSVSFCPAVRVTGVVVGVTVSPVPPPIVDVRVTGPAKPAEVIPAPVPEGRLPMVNVSVADKPDAKEIVGPVKEVMLKFSGLMITVTGCDLVWAGNTPLAAKDPEEVTLIVYDPKVGEGRRRPPVNVSVAVPDPPGNEVALSDAISRVVLAGLMAPFARVTVPVYPFDVTASDATPLEPAGQALP